VLVLSQYFHGGLKFDDVGRHVHAGSLFFYLRCESYSFGVTFWRHKRQKEEDIVVCECQYDILDPESPCGDRCLNFLTNTECTPGYCRCGVYCKNQVGFCYLGNNAVIAMSSGT